MADKFGFEPDPLGFVPDEEKPKTPVQQVAGHGFTKFAVPAVAGGLGGWGGAAAGAQLGAPFGPPGLITGAVLGGMLGAGSAAGGAEAGRMSLAGEPMNLGHIRNEALISGLTEPFGLVLGPGIKGAKSLRGAGGFAEAGKKFLGGVTEEIEQRFPGAAEKIAQIGVGRKGVKQANTALDALNNQLTQAAKSSPAQVQALDIMQPVMDVIGKLDAVGNPKGDAIIKRANAFLSTLYRRYGNKPLTAATVQEIKKAAQSAAESIYESIGMRQAEGKVLKRVSGKTAELNFQEAVAKGAREWLETHVPGAKELNAEMAAWIGARRSLKGPASRAARKNTARFTTAALAAATPTDIAPRMGLGVAGYTLGHMVEPLTTPMIGGTLDLMQNPAIQQLLLRQLPRMTGLGFNQAVSEQ